MFNNLQNAEIISALTKDFNEVRKEKPWYIRQKNSSCFLYVFLCICTLVSYLLIHLISTYL